MQSGSCKSLRRFLARLADKHADKETVFALRLAQTALDTLAFATPPAPGVAVIGPTQTGKSTVVNVLVGAEQVEASPLAAFTQRAAMLAVNMECDAREHPDYVPDGLRSTARRVDADCPACMLWDTPDFDSNASESYRQQTAQVCALVDLIVVVLSKEKYADQSVWRVLETVAPLDTPTVICLNKCEDGPPAPGIGGDDDPDHLPTDAGVLIPIIKRRLENNPRVASTIPVLALPRVAGGGLDDLLARRDVQAFRRAVFTRLGRRSKADRRAGLGRLARANWDLWVQPVEQELACHRAWTRLVAAGCGSFSKRYRSEYIEHARHHDVAQKAILGLLELLEIPALAGPLAKTRRTLTWPFRRLSAAVGRPAARDRDQELAVLAPAFDHCLLTLRREALGHRQRWWLALADELAAREPALRRDFHAAVEEYRRAFQPRIDQLSRDLYEQLERHPVTLNSLRAARVSADAGGLVLAIKTGALGLHDVLFAPAMISLTSYLTESAVGQYLKAVIRDLKREQMAHVDTIIRDKVEQPLRVLQPSGPDLFGITEAELAAARAQMKELGP